jgi:hypothetical protein
MSPIPNVEFQNSLREDGGPWALLRHLDQDGSETNEIGDAFSTEVYYSDSDEVGGKALESGEWIRIMSIREDAIELYPVQQRRGHATYGEPIFNNIRRLVLVERVNRPYAIPQTVEDLDGLLEELPDGFYRNWRHGLGVRWEYRVILNVIDSVSALDTVVFHGPPRPPRSDYLESDFFALSFETFNQLRKEVRLISGRHQRAARSEKMALCHNELLHRLDPARFELKRPRLAPDSLAELTRQSKGDVALSRRDQNAAITLVRRNAATLSNSQSRELMRLKEDIEAVTLGQLIDKCQSLMSSSASEARWQSFLKDNPFVLTMAFQFPVFMIDDVPYLGGKAYHGAGGKFGDFLMAVASTGNLALVEIKSPGTELLGAEYRQGVWPASKDLSGAVAQVIAQRETFAESFPIVGKELDREGYRAYMLACVVIIGSTPEKEGEKRAFERFRNSLHGVAVVTFDELIQRLRSIHQLLTASPPMPSMPVAPWEPKGSSNNEDPLEKELF